MHIRSFQFFSHPNNFNFYNLTYNNPFLIEIQYMAKKKGLRGSSKQDQEQNFSPKLKPQIKNKSRLGHRESCRQANRQRQKQRQKYNQLKNEMLSPEQMRVRQQNLRQNRMHKRYMQQKRQWHYTHEVDINSQICQINQDSVMNRGNCQVIQKMQNLLQNQNNQFYMDGQNLLDKISKLDSIHY